MLPLSPRTATVVRGIGRTLIGAGTLLLLFVAYQLWGTGVAHSREQARLEDRFDAQLAEVGRMLPDDDASTGDPPPDESTTTTLPPELVAALDPSPGDPVARLRMPTIGVDEIVVHGVGVADLRKGPGHFPDSPMPGQPGNAAIAGHRTTYGQPFHDLDRLAPGDEIHVDTLQGSFTYRVMPHEGPEGDERGHFIVPETAVEVLDDAGDDRLTLTACHPKFSSRQRIIVTAELVDEPAAPLPDAERPGTDDAGSVDAPGPDPAPGDGAAADEDFGEGLGGDPDALVPAVAWSAAFLVALAATALVGRRWRRWPAYLVGAPLMAVPLVVAFAHIDRYLPAY
ncbi:class E sortase [Actinomarinicola tropica]|nr:class E sortase [Actinomarinicola tropica]